MPWKQFKATPLSLPNRQDLMIIGASLIIGLIIIAVFVLRS